MQKGIQPPACLVHVCIEQAGGLEAFLHGAAQNFEVILNIQDQKLKIKNI
jgi:hypothetical protein